jgi:uncharacterized protein (DUF111 family)
VVRSEEVPGFVIDPAMGLAGDMFLAALIGLGVPAQVVIDAMERAARPLGGAKMQAKTIDSEEGAGIRLWIELEANDPHLAASDARAFLEATLRQEGLSVPYADLARRLLSPDGARARWA